MNFKDHVVKKLSLFKKEDIVFSDHALVRIVQRQLSKDEILENLLNPFRLEYAIKEDSSFAGEERFDCYFGYSKTLCHRYVIVIKSNVIVVTVVKINRRWQRIVHKKVKNV